MTMINCKLQIKELIKNKNDIELYEIHKWNKNKRKPNETYKQQHKKIKTSGKPNQTQMDKAYGSIHIKWCNSCKKQTTFINEKRHEHSKCQECGNTHGTNGKLNKQINKILYQNRGKKHGK